MQALVPCLDLAHALQVPRLRLQAADESGVPQRVMTCSAEGQGHSSRRGIWQHATALLLRSRQTPGPFSAAAQACTYATPISCSSCCSRAADEPAAWQEGVAQDSYVCMSCRKSSPEDMAANAAGTGQACASALVTTMSGAAADLAALQERAGLPWMHLCCESMPTQAMTISP